jgi:hypothetical protein
MRVMLDYNWDEHDLATRIADRIARGGDSVFVAHQDLKPGDNWKARLIQEASNSDFVLLIWTRKAASRVSSMGASTWELAQLIQQWAEGKLLILRVDGAELPFGLHGITALDASEKDAPIAAVRFLLEAKPADALTEDARPISHSGQLDARVFVSHSAAEPALVDPLFEALRAGGISYWSYRGRIGGSAGWAAQIVAALREASSLIACLSPAGAKSDHVLREMYLAMEFRKAIVPFVVNDADITDDHRYIIAGRQRFPLVPSSNLAEQLTLALSL